MEEFGRFVEIASIKNNELELENETLTNLFDGPDTRNTQIAIFSVLGSVRSKNSKLLGQMILRLLEDDHDTELDDTTTEQILTVGNDETSSQPRVVTWSTPFFITKGAKQKVAIFLLDIKGNFEDIHDKNYMALCGFCAFMSSTVLYITEGNVENWSIKHVESIALESVRHFGAQRSTVLQKLRIIIENWCSSDKYSYGDIDGDNFATKLAKSKKCSFFDAFEKSEFFLMPNINHEKYSHYFEKLLTTTLDSIYLVPKRLGGFIKAPVIISELKRYADAMDADEEFHGCFKDFFAHKKPEATIREQLENATVAAPEKVPEKPIPKPRKINRNTNLPSSLNLPNDETQKSKSTTCSTTMEETVTSGKIDQNSNLLTEDFDSENEVKYTTHIPYYSLFDRKEKFDLTPFLQPKNAQLATDINKENEVLSSEPIPTALQILERIKTAFSMDTPCTSTDSGPETILTADVLTENTSYTRYEDIPRHIPDISQISDEIDALQMSQFLPINEPSHNPIAHSRVSLPKKNVERQPMPDILQSTETTSAPACVTTKLPYNVKECKRSTMGSSSTNDTSTIAKGKVAMLAQIFSEKPTAEGRNFEKLSRNNSTGSNFS